MKVAVVLFNLGGPDSLAAVEPFLRNLFSDPAIISLPTFLRKPLARLIARRRAPVARDIYKQLGGRSPILEESLAQAQALEDALHRRGMQAKTFVAMRAWKPFARETAEAVSRWQPDRVILLPLYPQFSTTTTHSSVQDWKRAAQTVGLATTENRICCYPWEDGFIAAEAELVLAALAERRQGVNYRLLLSAHGLPQRVISKGDPYQWQVERTAQAIVDKLVAADLDWRLCYQSRVGPLKWIGPATDTEIRRAGAERCGVIVAPVAFVSEHSETLVELDIEYRKLAQEAGVPHYLRAPAVGTHPLFIAGLATLVAKAVTENVPITCGSGRICPGRFSACGYGAQHA